MAQALSELAGTDVRPALARVDERVRLKVAHAAAAEKLAGQRASARAEHEADRERWDDDGGNQPAAAPRRETNQPAAPRRATKREM